MRTKNSKTEAECRVGSRLRSDEQSEDARKGFQIGVAWALTTVIEKLRAAENDLSEQPGDYAQIARWIERRSGSW